MSVVKVAAVQLSPVLYIREGTVAKIVAKIGELARQGVQFAVFPETVVPNYPYFSFVQRLFEMAAEHLKHMEQSVTVVLRKNSITGFEMACVWRIRIYRIDPATIQVLRR
jgi:predicted amidohydrolase